MKKNLLLVTLFLTAFLERTVFDFGPNYELVTTSMLLAAFYLGRKESFWLTFAIIAATDRVIGNSNIFLFTWSGFLIPALFASNMIKTLKLKMKLNLFPLLGTGVTANLFFFLWTNFGVWLLDSWGMYPDTLQGLAMSYINALPFLRNQLASTIILLPTGFFITEFIRKLIPAPKPSSTYNSA